MRLLPAIKDPITLKRVARFKQNTRALISVWVLVVLYIISLGSELVSNNRPLYLRHNDKSHFPAFRFYPEKIFLPGGKDTRPDYRALRQHPTFRDAPGNFMIFPLLPYSPLESLDPETLRDEERVIVRFTPVPRVGNVNILPDFTISRSREIGFFFGRDDADVNGRQLMDFWKPTPTFEKAIARRFSNEAAPSLATELTSIADADLKARISLSRYQRRSKPPTTVRLTFRQPEVAATESEQIEFSRSMKPFGKVAQLWNRLSDTDRSEMLEAVERRFSETVYPQPIVINSTRYNVDISINDISWPYRPVGRHWFGIDSAGRDVFARILYGLRISMTFGFVLAIMSMAVGILVGAVQGYYGGGIDITGQRLIEIWSAIPFLYVMILLGSIYGRSFQLLLFCYAIFNWIGISYYMRAEFLRLRGQAFVDSAKCLGVRAPRIMIRHILPNAITPVITLFPFSLVGAIGALAALDYLGFGLPPPKPSWGELLHQAQQFRWAWWLILYPSLALFIVMLLGVFVGEGVRDAFDPRRYSRME
jgi:microcin C transport system permease protein